MRIEAYETPRLIDYGGLTDITEATVFRGPEDGAVKIELVIPHHSLP